MKAFDARLEDLFSPLAKIHGLTIVRVHFSQGQKGKLQVMIERADDTPVSMDDCVRLSRDLSYFLDVEDPIQGSYHLEVTSPGPDRPLVKPGDFARFDGHRIKVSLNKPLEDGRKVYQGVLRYVDENTFDLDLGAESPMVRIDYHHIRQASLAPEEIPVVKGKKKAGSPKRA